MKIVKGIYTETKIFTDDIKPYAEAQVKMVCHLHKQKGNKVDRRGRAILSLLFCI